MNATETAFLTGTLGSIGTFLNIPGAGLLLGFGVAWYCFHQICRQCGRKK